MNNENGQRSSGGDAFSGTLPLGRVMRVVAVVLTGFAAVFGLTLLDFGTDHFRPDMFMISLGCIAAATFLFMKKVPPEKTVSKRAVWVTVLVLMAIEYILRMD